MIKRGTDDIREKTIGEGEETYKVRVAVTLAHYVLVTAKDHDDAERKVDEYVHELGSDLDRWMDEASHINTSFEVEEADEVCHESKDLACHESEDLACHESSEVPKLDCCPRCGEDFAEFVHPAYDGGSYVRCANCRYSPQKETWAPTDAKAAVKWNRLERRGKS